MEKFLFGVATASHQNEGNNFLNNWWDWEIKKNLERSGIACNSWNDFRKDINCVKELGCNCYRFSLEWSRIFIDEETVDLIALARYEEMIDYCIELGIEPIITLHHFTRPRWFDNNYGGLHNRLFLDFFKKYVKVVCKKFGAKVKWWITFNEPMLECVNGYLRGTRPPGKTGDFELMYLAIINILDSHCLAYKIIKKYNENSMVSISKNLVDFEKQYTYDVVKSKIEDQVINNFNWGILDAFYKGEFNYGINLAGIGLKKTKKREAWIGKLDFLGVNHYNVGYVDISYTINNPINVLLMKKDNKYIKNSLKWDIKPFSMDNVVKNIIEKYGNIKIFITESGACEKKDRPKNNHIQMHVLNSHMKSIVKNKNVCGYLWWTLIDNYEWEDGWKPKFGLYKMIRNENNYERVMKDSGKKYKDFIENFSR